MYLYDCIGRVMRVINKKVYYFNYHGEYSQTTIREAKDKKLDGLFFNQSTGKYCEESYKCDCDTKALDRAVACLKLGDTIEDFEKYVYRFDRLYHMEMERPFINNVIRIAEGKFYFFNEQGVYTCLKEKEILPTDIRISVVSNIPGKRTSYSCYHELRKLAEVYEVDNMNLFAKVICMLKPGDSFFTLEDYCYNKKIILTRNKKPEGVDRFITKIQRPEFVCSPENPNPKETFDYIHVYADIVSNWETDKKTYIQEHIKEINQKVLTKIESSKSFKKYGIPINYLKASQIVLVDRIDQIHYVFELKK